MSFSRASPASPVGEPQVCVAGMETTPLDKTNLDDADM